MAGVCGIAVFGIDGDNSEIGDVTVFRGQILQRDDHLGGVLLRIDGHFLPFGKSGFDAVIDGCEKCEVHDGAGRS